METTYQHKGFEIYNIGGQWYVDGVCDYGVKAVYLAKQAIDAELTRMASEIISQL